MAKAQDIIEAEKSRAPYLSEEEKETMRIIADKILPIKKQARKMFEEKGVEWRKEIINNFLNPYISPDKAKNVAEMLFLKRLDLRKNETATAIYAMFSQYYDGNTESNLIFGKWALETEGTGMCDTRSFWPLTYESPY